MSLRIGFYLWEQEQMRQQNKKLNAKLRMAFADHVYAVSEPNPTECPNCGRLLEECNGNCIFDGLPNHGFTARERVEDTMTAEDRKEQFGEECVYCGKDSWTCEHFSREQSSDKPYSSRDEGRNPDGTGESYAERNT